MTLLTGMESSIVTMESHISYIFFFLFLGTFQPLITFVLYFLVFDTFLVIFGKLICLR